MKIEMKSLRKNLSGDSSKLKADSRCGDPEIHDRHLPQVSKLPFIPDTPPVESEEASTKLSITVTRAKTQKHQNSGLVGKREPESIPNVTHQSPRTGGGTSASIITSSGAVAPNTSTLLSVTSIGKSKGMVHMATPESRHNAGGKGRLSHGWSPPQAIEPLKGSPIRRRVGAYSAEEGADGQDKPGLSPTASMMIDINVNEFLNEQTDRN